MEARIICGMIPLFLYVLSVCAHAWMLVEVNPSRSTCTEIAYETIAVLVLNIFIACRRRVSGLFIRTRLHGRLCQILFYNWTCGSRGNRARSWVQAYPFCLQAHLICPVNASEIPADDMLLDEGRDATRPAMAAWFGILLLGLALLLQHGGIGCGGDDDDDDDYEDKKYDDDNRDRFWKAHEA